MKRTGKWIIVLVAWDDAQIPSRVIKERIDADEDPQMAALLRGGHLVTVIELDCEMVAEAERAFTEKECLR
jgi:hypothetical protein